ncbi:unnamed protein product, partial [Prunus brigantina]
MYHTFQHQFPTIFATHLSTASCIHEVLHFEVPYQMTDEFDRMISEPQNLPDA